MGQLCNLYDKIFCKSKLSIIMAESIYSLYSSDIQRQNYMLKNVKKI